jgi:hypothetical protein
MIERCWIYLARMPCCKICRLLKIHENSTWPPNQVLWLNNFCFKRWTQINVSIVRLLHLDVKTVLFSHLDYVFFLFTQFSFIIKITKSKHSQTPLNKSKRGYSYYGSTERSLHIIKPFLQFCRWHTIRTLIHQLFIAYAQSCKWFQIVFMPKVYRNDSSKSCTAR